MIKLAICDDQYDELAKINKLVKEYCDLCHYEAKIYLYDNVDSLLSEIENINCLILDVLLNDMTGIDVAREIYQKNKDIKIIFCSTNPEYSIEAFEVNAFRYLVKPINKVKLFEYLDMVRKYYDELSITINDTNHRIRTISIFDICYIDMAGRKSTIHLKNKKTITVIRQMKEWIAILGDLGFHLSYKGILVNLKYVSSIDDNLITLKNGETIYLSRLYKKTFQSAFYDMLGEMI